MKCVWCEGGTAHETLDEKGYKRWTCGSCGGFFVDERQYADNFRKRWPNGAPA